MSPAPFASPAIEVRDLGIRYGQRRVLGSLSLLVPRGCVYALLGRNGAGKSSLVRCLLGHQKATTGKISVLGFDVWKERAETMEHLGVVPEQPDAPPEMTARQLVAFCGRLYHTWDEPGVIARLVRFQVPLDLPFHLLSKGQEGAVMLSLALGNAPQLLILDDPTLGLDVIARNAVFGEVIADLADHGTTVFLTTHDLSGVEGIAQRVGILKDGALVLDDDLEAVKSRWARSLEDIFVGVMAGERGAA